jgi:hypothetical protein
MFFFRTIFKNTYQGDRKVWGLGLGGGFHSLLTTHLFSVFQHFSKKRNILKNNLFFNYTTGEPPNPNLQTFSLLNKSS